MDVDTQKRPRQRGTLWLGAVLVGLVLVFIFVPPFIGISRYKSRITQLVSTAVGRPVRLSEVELRMLPRPGFLLTDLTVEEDPAYGSEPVLHANTVSASIRFASLWRGQLQISRISVDEASLNLVRTGDGRWNIDSVFRNAAAGSGRGRMAPRPYLEATSSRINIKNGAEKLPFSLVDADAALWQESDGEWRVRLKGQPARTDVSLDLADTGIVRLEGTLRPAPQLYQMPLHVDADWRDAQLGQLSRLLLGSDEGWRGDLHGELHLDGTASEAHVQARLRASGVHREEFAPAAPLDFDASCAFDFHYPSRSLEKLDCNSPVGDGRARLTGNVPSGGQPPRLTLELDRIPAQAALDVLRTVRSKLDASLEAAGTVSGRLTYDSAEETPPPVSQPRKAAAHAAQSHAPAGPLSGSLTVDGLRITGDDLARPIQLARVSLEPAPAEPDERSALITTVAVPAGGTAPLTVHARFALAGFQVAVHGPVAMARLHEFARISGSGADGILTQIAGDPVSVDLEANGPWLPPVEVTLGATTAPRAPSLQANAMIAFRNANWKPAFLAHAVLLQQATLHVESGALRWDPVDFSYGPLKGSATLAIPTACDPPATCVPQFTAHFGSLDAAEVQSTLLGAQESGTLLSSLLDRLAPNSAPQWPEAEGTVQADSLVAGAFTFARVSAELKLTRTQAELTRLEAATLGGELNGTATLQGGAQPQYTINAEFSGLNPSMVGDLLGMNWSGTNFRGSGELAMSGYTSKDLAASAKGTLNFAWGRGGIASPGIPPALSRFESWTGEVSIAEGGLKLDQNKVMRAGRSASVQARVAFAQPAKVEFGPAAGTKSPPVK